MPDEHPPLGSTFIAGFQNDNLGWPILAVARDPRVNTGYVVPAVGSTTGLSVEAIGLYPNNAFTVVQQISEQRVLWIYERLPGPVLTSPGLSEAAQGANTNQTTQRFAYGPAPVTPDYKTMAYRDVATSSVITERHLEVMSESAFPILTDRRLEQGIGIPVKYSESKQRVDHNAANVGSITVAGSGGSTVVTVTEYQQGSKQFDIKITGVLNASTLPAYSYGAGLFQSLEYATRSYEFPDEIRGTESTATGIVIQRAKGYRGPVECLKATRLTLPTASATQAQPSRLFVPIKWYVDDIALNKTTGADILQADSIWVTNSVDFGNGINGALHPAIYFGTIVITDTNGHSATQDYIGPNDSGQMLAFVTKVRAANNISAGPSYFIGLLFPATDPPTLALADIGVAQPDSVLDFGASYGNDWVCIAVDSADWHFGCLLETYWFAKPVRSSSDRDAEPATVTIEA